MEAFVLFIVLALIFTLIYFLHQALSAGRAQAVLEMRAEADKRIDAEVEEYKRKLNEIDTTKVEFAGEPLISAHDATSVLSGRVIKGSKREVSIASSPDSKRDSN
jgi:hypothetical protein